MIAIASPSDRATYAPNAKVGASYVCTDGGAGITSCAGPVANGNLVNTSPMGTRTFMVTATDAVGNRSTRSVTEGLAQEMITSTIERVWT
jgi:hypothetical protein